MLTTGWGIYSKVVIVSIIILFSTFLFQNCSSEIENTMVSNIPPVKTLTIANADEVPFAFDTTINEIAYMSCAHAIVPSEVNANFNPNHMNNPGAYFSFKIGAYGSNSGVGLTNEFRNYLISNFSDNNQVVPNSIVRSAFTISTQNRGSSLIFANRPMSNPVGTIFVALNNTEKPAIKREYDLLLSQNFTYSSLTYGSNLQQLSELMNKSSASRINNFLQLSTSHNLFASLNYHFSADYTLNAAEAMRKHFSDGQNSTLLTLAYTRDLADPANQSEPTVPRRTFRGTDNSIWGRGYRPSFGQDPRPKGLGFNNVLSSIEEYDMSDGLKPIAATWNCNIKYLIISPIDNDSTSAANNYPNPVGEPLATFQRCSDPLDSELSASQKLELALMQRYVPGWIINPIHKCIVPRAGDGDCYQRRMADVDGVSILNKYTKTNSTDTCGPGTPYACPEFLSICTRD